MKLISALLGALLLYALLDFLYIKYWKSKLSVELSFSKDFATEGEEISLIEVVTNRKLLPLSILQVKFAASRFLEFDDKDNSAISDLYYRNDMLTIMMYQRLTKTLAIHCAHRGYYTIQRMDLVCSNLFMSHEEVATYDLNIFLSVYPRTIDALKFEVAFSKMLGTVLTRRFINEDPFEFNNIREYQSYDSLKSINWKASAKTDSLKVNVHDYTSSQQVKIFINTESDTVRKYDDLSEESIRIATTLAQALIAKGVPISIHTNALDIITKEIIEIPAGSGSNHYKTIQESLSRIDLTLEPPAFLPSFQEQITSTAVKDYLIIISYYQREKLQQLLISQMHARKEFVWIIPTNFEISVVVSEELVGKIIPWETERN